MSEYIVGTDGHEGHWITGERIVRCRDCKNFESDYGDAPDFDFCPNCGRKVVE